MLPAVMETAELRHAKQTTTEGMGMSIEGQGSGFKRIIDSYLHRELNDLECRNKLVETIKAGASEGELTLIAIFEQIARIERGHSTALFLKGSERWNEELEWEKLRQLLDARLAAQGEKARTK